MIVREWQLMVPEEIKLVKDRASLEIRWSDGVTHRLGAGTLRAHCYSATAIRGVETSAAASPDLDATRITRIETVGAYAVHLSFSDGEERGIYPWPLLRRLGE